MTDGRRDYGKSEAPTVFRWMHMILLAGGLFCAPAAEAAVTISQDWQSSGCQALFVDRKGFVSPTTGLCHDGEYSDETCQFNIVAQPGKQANVRIEYVDYYSSTGYRYLQVYNVNNDFETDMDLYDVYERSFTDGTSLIVRARPIGSDYLGNRNLRCYFDISVTYEPIAPDLTVTTFATNPSVEAEKGAAKNLDITVKNVGCLQAGGTTVTVYDGAEKLSSYTVPPLSPGATSPKRIDISKLAVGNHQLRAVITAVAGEKVTGNNSGSMGFLVYDGAIPVKVHFDSNGGSGTMADQKVAYGEEFYLIRNSFLRSGYAFMGWSTTKAGAVVYADGQQIHMNVHDDFTLYAVWESTAIRFDPNGGTGAMPDQEAVQNGKTLLQNNAFVRENFIFRGWSTVRGGPIAYTDGMEADIPLGGVTLYAVWQSFKVSFDPNGGTGTMADQYFSRDTLKLPSCRFAHEGYEFVGWSRYPDEHPCYVNEGTVTMKSLVITDPKLPEDGQTLYACWGKRVVAEHGDGIVNRTDNVVFYTGGRNSKTGETDGCGWRENAAAGVQSPEPRQMGLKTWLVAQVRGPGRFTAKTDDRSNVAFKGRIMAFVNGRIDIRAYVGAGEEDSCGGLYCFSAMDPGLSGISKTVTISIFEEGVCNVAWYKGVHDTDTGCQTVSDVSMTPTVAIGFDANGGTASAIPKLYEQGQKYGELPTATKRQATFLGWFTAAVGGTRVTSESVVGSPRTLYAHWMMNLPADSYGIIFDPNGGTGAMADLICARDKVYNLTKCAFKKTGTAFKGWAGSNGKRYDDGVLIFNAAEDDEILTLTAIWELAEIR